MRLNLKTPPIVEPIDLETVKNHLRVDGGEDNALISSLVVTARQIAESETKRAFITQTWLMYLDKALQTIEIPKPPLQSIVSILAISSVESYVDETSAAVQPILKVASTSGFTISDTVIINRDGDREEKLIVLSIQTDVSLTMTTNLAKEHTAAQADKVEKYILVNPTKYNIDASENSYGRVQPRSGYAWPVHRGFASFIIELKAGYGDAVTDVPEGIKQNLLVLIGYMYENRGGEGAHVLEEAKILFAPYKITRI